MTEKDRVPDIANVGVRPTMPRVYERDPRDPRRDEMPADLVGATIRAIGSLDGETTVGGGGFVIDYLPGKGEDVRRIVFGFSELGMWIEYHSP